MKRILGPFRKRVLQSAASFPVIVTQQYLTQFLKRDYWNLIYGIHLKDENRIIRKYQRKFGLFKL